MLHGECGTGLTERQDKGKPHRIVHPDLGHCVRDRLVREDRSTHFPPGVSGHDFDPFADASWFGIERTSESHDPVKVRRPLVPNPEEIERNVVVSFEPEHPIEVILDIRVSEVVTTRKRGVRQLANP